MGEKFNENLKECRLQSGYTQKEISENIGVANTTYVFYMKAEVVNLMLKP